MLQSLACKFPTMSLLVLVSCVSGAVAVWICGCACHCCKIHLGLATFGLFLAVGGARHGLVNVVVIIIVIVAHHTTPDFTHHALSDGHMAARGELHP